MTEPTPRLLARSPNALAAASVGAAGVLIAACGATSPSGSASLPTLPAGAASTPSPAPS